jgi:calpain-15
LQGQLGDCYFLSTLSAMAEFPKRIEKLFDTATYEESGCYTVKIQVMGIWEDIVLDDFFPCTEDGQIAFSRSKVESAAEIWVILLEKAWAKIFGSYYAI